VYLVNYILEHGKWRAFSMKNLRFLALSSILLSALTASCAFNIFSVFNPTDPSGVSDPNTLVAMGDDYLASLEYTNAFNCYSRAMSLAPKNSRAIDGACTSFLYMRVPMTNLIMAMVSSSFSINGWQNAIYASAAYIHTNLYKIISGQADGVIPANDVNVNLNFYFFNQIYAIFFSVDTDNDGNVVNDPNDLISIDTSYNVNENPPLVNAINDIGKFNSAGPGLNPIQALNIIPVSAALSLKYTSFTNDQAQDLVASNNVINGLATSQAKQEFIQITSAFTSGMNNINTLFNSVNVALPFPLTGTLFDFTNYFQLTGAFGYAGVTGWITYPSPPAAIDELTPCFQGPNGAGYNFHSLSSYIAFTNDLIQSGVTDPGTLALNMPNVTQANMVIFIAAYFGLPNPPLP
jgi:hypothetical protein